MWKEVKTLKLKSVFVVALIMIIVPAMMRTFAYSAKSVCLFDMKTKEVIYGYNEDVPMEPASITKIVTAITALSLGDEDEVITVDEKSAGKGKQDLLFAYRYVPGYVHWCSHRLCHG